MRFLATLLIAFISLAAFAQKKTATVSGRVINENENPMVGVSVTVLGHQKGIVTNDSGFFSLKITADRAFALEFTHQGFRTEQRNFILNDGEHETVTVKMVKASKTLETVVIQQDDKQKKEISLTRINPKTALYVPSTVGGIESMIKMLVGGNNELTSQYSVRGGNYDENLIYINDFEIFRPYLVRSGQQEGLSFINPELTQNVNFYNGGFQAKYGDKISSVLDIQYKKPKGIEGSAYVSLLEQGFHFEGSSANDKFTYIFGVRNRSNKNLLASQETKGSYVPSSSDAQGYFTYKVNDKFQLELLGVVSGTKFLLVPESAQKSSAVFSPLFTTTLGLDIDRKSVV